MGGAKNRYVPFRLAPEDEGLTMTYSLPRQPIHLLRNLERCVDEAFAELIHARWGAGIAAAWQPAIEIHETAEEYLVVVDLPGVTPDEVRVRVDDHLLTIHGRRAAQRRGKAGEMIYSERTEGEFMRSIPLPSAVDPALSEIHFDQGLQIIRLTKRRSAGLE